MSLHGIAPLETERRLERVLASLKVPRRNIKALHVSKQEYDAIARTFWPPLRQTEIIVCFGIPLRVKA